MNRSVPKTNFVFWLLTASASLLLPELALANVLDEFGNKLVGIMNNNFLRSLAGLAVMGAGIMAWSGRMEWSRFFIILLGVVIVFGSFTIVDYIKGAVTSAGI